MKWYWRVWRNYLFYEGRARRTEFWVFQFINLLVYWVLKFTESYKDWGTLLTGIYGLLVFLPAITVSVRRLHDIGRSGWWILISFVPVVGTLVLFVFACLDSEEGSNRYGPNPKYD
ncbi:DUF805 domain-containing protein [Bacillus salacetis]|uniref:DUF805 domain-containing protein n=1 Tax=Bacillus salacetis TaxID=2315464 RepID=A0A3A1QYW2_9BACI|nr:DUF805 domain-containing protein [Bacillus salacetis]RIW34021.1 DUF805 domain-containing protein [Bacillus salacetis]